MKPRLLEKLACPSCRASNWQVQADKKENDDVVEGGLACACGKTYPIKDSVVFFEIDQQNDTDSAWNEWFSKLDPEKLKSEMERTRKYVESGLAVQGCLMARLLSRRGETFKSYLDIGCGGGAYSWMIHTVRPDMQLTLLDYSVPGVLMARENFRAIGLDADFVQGDAFNLPFKDGAFALSSTAGLLEHFEEEKQKAILAQQARVSSANLCQVPVRTLGYWMLRTFIEWRRGKWPFGFEVPLAPKKLRALLKEQGWEPKAFAAQSLFTAFSLHVVRIRFSWFYRIFAFMEKILAYDHCLLCEQATSPRRPLP